MYDYVVGTLVALGEERAVVETAAGVGFEVKIPASTAETIRGQDRVQLYTALRLRDEQLHLYGFATIEEREIFARVCTISGIGPGTALAILSGIPLEEFRAAVADGQVKVLEKIKGIGRKTAQRLILELREVLVATAPPTTTAAPRRRQGHDAVAALIAIGFGPTQADAAVREALQESPEAPLEELVKLATRFARG